MGFYNIKYLLLIVEVYLTPNALIIEAHAQDSLCDLSFMLISAKKLRGKYLKLGTFLFTKKKKKKKNGHGFNSRA